MKKYPEEIKQKASELVRSGMSKLQASIKLGIPYRTVIDWTLAISQRRRYPKYLKRRIRNLVKKGLPKVEASRITGIPYTSVLIYTKDIRSGRNTERITGQTLNLLRELVERGYVFSVGNFKSSYRTLQKYFPVRTTKFHRVRVIYMIGSERKAMEGLLEKLNLKSLDYGKLGYIRTAFGIKNMKQNNKIRERV